MSIWRVPKKMLKNWKIDLSTYTKATALRKQMRFTQMAFFEEMLVVFKKSNEVKKYARRVDRKEGVASVEA
jgi:hypothetical protein